MTYEHTPLMSASIARRIVRIAVYAYGGNNYGDN